MGLMAQGRTSASSGAPTHSGTATLAPATAGAAHAGARDTAGAAARSMSGAAGHTPAARTPNGQAIVRRGTAMHSAQGPTRGHTTGIVNHRGQTTARRRNGVSEFENDPNSVPGLGFDYAHFAATHPNGVRGRGRHSRSDGAVLFPFFDGGYFVPTGPGALDDVAGNGQTEDDGAEQAEADFADRPVRIHSADRPPEYGPPAAQPDVPEYVFVRRDGTLFFAVAYSWDRDSLRYISTGGVRRSVSRDTLDLNATQQFNEQRGMTFRSPA
jgi:hypothetical protein